MGEGGSDAATYWHQENIAKRQLCYHIATPLLFVCLLFVWFGFLTSCCLRSSTHCDTLHLWRGPAEQFTSPSRHPLHPIPGHRCLGSVLTAQHHLHPAAIPTIAFTVWPLPLVPLLQQASLLLIFGESFPSEVRSPDLGSSCIRRVRSFEKWPSQPTERNC